VDVVVGGHSHTLLGKFDDANLPVGSGAYPTVVQNASSQTALVVQAWQWGILLGKLEVTFDAEGNVTRWSGSPIPVAESIVPDPLMESVILAFRRPIDSLAKAVIGVAETDLPTARGGESVMGNFIADAQLEACKKMGAELALMNAGGVRASLQPGEVTYGDLIMVQPFGNTLVLIELTGQEIKAALEHGVRQMPGGTGGMLYVSKGTSYTVDSSKPAGSRVVDVDINGEKMDLSKTYKVVVNSFIAAGGDAHTVIQQAKGSRVDTGLVDLDALIDYFKSQTPVKRVLEGRIKLIGELALKWAA
jgi:5'-nucleotidase/UDP-sugar diphosphatase